MSDHKAGCLVSLGLWLLSGDRTTSITQAGGHKCTGLASCTTDLQLLETLLLRGAYTADGINALCILYGDSETEISWCGRPGEAVCCTTWHGPLVESQIQRLLEGFSCLAALACIRISWRGGFVVYREAFDVHPPDVHASSRPPHGHTVSFTCVGRASWISPKGTCICLPM